MLKLLPAMQETRVRFLGWEDPLEKEMAIHSSTLPGKSHGWRSLIGYSPWGCKESDATEHIETEMLNNVIIQSSKFWLLSVASNSAYKLSCSSSSPSLFLYFLRIS